MVVIEYFNINDKVIGHCLFMDLDESKKVPWEPARVTRNDKDASAHKRSPAGAVLSDDHNS